MKTIVKVLAAYFGVAALLYIANSCLNCAQSSTAGLVVFAIGLVALLIIGMSMGGDNK